MKTVIMAGGKGSRISTLFPTVPKPMIPIKRADGSEKPVLEWEIESLISQGFEDIILTVGYMHEKIEAYFEDGHRWGCRIQYYVEEKPLGNAGALFKIREALGNKPFLLLNADTMFEMDFNRMVRYHQNKGAQATIFTHPNSHPYDSGIVITDEDGAVEEWLTKEDTRPQWYKNRVNAGLHVISPEILDMNGIDADTVGKEIDGEVVKVDLDRQVLKPLCGSRKMFAYDSPEYVKDMGTPERYMTVSRDFQNGVVHERNLSRRQKAIFVDRDGTINKYRGFLRDIGQFELIDGVPEAIRRINESGYLCIVVTNQPVIARGEVTREQLNEIHMKMETLLGAEGAYVDGIYYCPHHPDSGFEGEVKALKFDCDCRKPKPGMLLRAAQDYHIDLSNSWMIGDGVNDVRAGKAAGCRTAMIGEEADCEPDIRAVNLLDSINRIMREKV